MDFFQEGQYYKEVSQAQLENIVNYVDKGLQAIRSASAFDWKRKDLERARRRVKSLKDELEFVLNTCDISQKSIEALRHVINDDAVPTDTTAELSSETQYSKVRYLNPPISEMNELNELVRKNSSSTLNRIINLIAEINFTRVSIAKYEAEMSNIAAARKAFLDKKDADPEGFDRLKNMLLDISELSGYVQALISLVGSYPSVSPTDNTIRSITSNFDLMCWKWSRYRARLERGLQKFVNTYSEAVVEEIPVKEYSPFDPSEVELVTEYLSKHFDVVYDSKTQKMKVRSKTLQELFVSMSEFMYGPKLPKNYKGVSDDPKTSMDLLLALIVPVQVSAQIVEEMLSKWSGGTDKLSSNPAISKVIDKARQLVASPVIKTRTDPMTRDAFLKKTLIDFKGVSKTIKEVRDFLEGNTKDLQDTITRGLVKFDTEYLRKTWLRKAMPIPDNVRAMNPVEDSVRMRVRRRYGPTVPFEDEVNTGTDKKPLWVKESYCVQNKDGKWVLKSDLAVKVLEQYNNPTDVSARQ
jgi:hypothetical protein